MDPTVDTVDLEEVVIVLMVRIVVDMVLIVVLQWLTH